VTVSGALFVAPPYDPPIVAVVVAVTAVVPTVNVALVAPAAIATAAGTVATVVLLLLRPTDAPPDGAALVNVAVPCTAFPPTTVDGLSAIDDSAGDGGGGGGAAPALTTSEVAALRRCSAVIVTVVSALTDVVAIGNVAVVAPAGTVTVPGTLAAAFELNS